MPMKPPASVGMSLAAGRYAGAADRSRCVRGQPQAHGRFRPQGRHPRAAACQDAQVARHRQAPDRAGGGGRVLPEGVARPRRWSRAASRDVLVTNEVAGAAKLARLAALAKRATVGVCVDDIGSVAELEAAADEAGSMLDVLVEIDVGGRRCGVAPGAAAARIAERIAGVTTLMLCRPAGLSRLGPARAGGRRPAREDRARGGLRAGDPARPAGGGARGAR